MGITLDDLRDRVRSRLNLPSDDEVATDTELDRSINIGLESMATDFDWPWLQVVTTINTTTGVQTVNLPDRCTRVQYASVSNPAYRGFQMTARQFSYITTMMNNNNSMPTDYAIINDTMYLSPTPSDTYPITLVYIQTEPPLVSDDDETLCPEWYADLIVTYACIDTAIRLQDNIRLQQLTAIKQDWIRKISDAVVKSGVAPAISLRTDF